MKDFFAMVGLRPLALKNSPAFPIERRLVIAALKVYLRNMRIHRAYVHSKTTLVVFPRNYDYRIHLTAVDLLDHYRGKVITL